MSGAIVSVHLSCHRVRFLPILALCTTPFGGLRAVGPGIFRVGAARVEITPAPDAALPMSGYANRTRGFKGIHDSIYVRAIVVDHFVNLGLG